MRADRPSDAPTDPPPDADPIPRPDPDSESGIILDESQFDVTRHNGMITVHNPATGNHRTFRVMTINRGELIGKRIVGLLTGPDRDNPFDWVGFGFVDDNGIKIWSRYRSTDFEKFARILECPKQFGARGLRYMVESRCRRCNRALTHPDSIGSGLGPQCAGRD